MIRFHTTDQEFTAALRPGNDEWIETSISWSPRAIGAYRLPVPDNGRYESKHPVLDASGNEVGYLVDGASSLGYTTVCLYAGDCFWIAHKTFSAVLQHADVSRVSLVDAAGAFLFSGTTKYKVVKSFGFGGQWDSEIKVFKMLDGGRRLLYLSTYGFCFFDTQAREAVTRREFSFAHQWSGFALSPKVHLLAVACSERGERDLLDGEYRYTNSVRVFDLESGECIGEECLPPNSEARWIVEFSESGRQLRVTSASVAYTFILTAT